MLITVHKQTSIQDIKFNFEYNFPSSEQGENQQPEEGEGGEGGIQLGGYTLYIIAGVLVIAAIGAVVVKKVLS